MIIGLSIFVGILAIAVAVVPILVAMHLHHTDDPWTVNVEVINAAEGVREGDARVTTIPEPAHSHRPTSTHESRIRELV